MKKIVFVAALSGILLTSCINADENLAGNEQKNETYFNFATTRTSQIDVKYDITGYRSGILFEVYAESPINANGTRKDIKALFKAYTDNKGAFTGTISLPTYLTSVFMSTDSYVINAHKEVAVTNGSIHFDGTVLPASSRALTKGAHHKYPTEFFPMNDKDDWNELGVPSYLNPNGRKAVPNGLLSDIATTLPQSQKLSTGSHAYLANPNCKHDISIVKASKISMTFLGELAGYTNPVGYYSYPTNNPPKSPSEIGRQILLFPNATIATDPGEGIGGLLPGDNINLLYWDGTKYVDTFPAGVSIGFFIQSNGFDGPGPYRPNGPYTYDLVNYDAEGVFYSTAALNYQNPAAWYQSILPTKQHTVALYDRQIEGRKGVVIGFEDTPTYSADLDYNDMIFYVQGDPTDAIDIPDGRDGDLNPDPNPEPKSYTIEYEGTLAFEDLWPSRGDYDMNDAGVRYHSTVYYNEQNQIFKTEDTFIPVCKGGTYTNGFGFQYGVTTDKVTSCVVNASAGAPTSPYQTISGSALEAGQSKAVVMLFNDIKSQVTGSHLDSSKSSQQPIYTYTVVTQFKNIGTTELGFPPYNPFIVVIPTDSNEDPRGREVHLTNFRPTDKCTDSAGLWFGKYQDKSDKINYWYVSDGGFPFAINIPTLSFHFPNENQCIDDAYTRFANWAASNGAQDADWWK